MATEDNTTKINFLDITQRRYTNEKGVIWEVEKHYTWFVYIVAGALFNLQNINANCTPDFR